jgi:uncharacterized short protein YbdD (DUF466 family)
VKGLGHAYLIKNYKSVVNPLLGMPEYSDYATLNKNNGVDNNYMYGETYGVNHDSFHSYHNRKQSTGDNRRIRHSSANSNMNSGSSPFRNNAKKPTPHKGEDNRVSMRTSFISNLFNL